MTDVINTPAFWTIRCDFLGCEATYSATKTPHRLDALAEIESAGWKVGNEIYPGDHLPDYCPEHNR